MLGRTTEWHGDEVHGSAASLSGPKVPGDPSSSECNRFIQQPAPGGDGVLLSVHVNLPVSCYAIDLPKGLGLYVHYDDLRVSESAVSE